MSVYKRLYIWAPHLLLANTQGGSPSPPPARSGGGNRPLSSAAGPVLSGLKISKMALSEQSDATALFSAVCYTLCDTYIDFPQSVNSGKSI